MWAGRESRTTRDAKWTDRQIGLTGIVLEAFAHFLSVPGQHKAVHDEVLKGGLVEQRRPKHCQCVEPASRLRDKTQGFTWFNM